LLNLKFLIENYELISRYIVSILAGHRYYSIYMNLKNRIFTKHLREKKKKKHNYELIITNTKIKKKKTKKKIFLQKTKKKKKKKNMIMN